MFGIGILEDKSSEGLFSYVKSGSRRSWGWFVTVGLKGPTLIYNNAKITPGITHYVYKYATTLDRFLTCFIQAGITALGKKLVLATPHLHIIRTIVSKEGWHLKHGLVTLQSPIFGYL